MTERKVVKIQKGQKATDGAGVRLTRLFGHENANLFDPFLMMDHFGSENPNDYIAGFPFHPHRGIETVTYMLSGKMEHSDSLGNQGTIGSGDIQWMTAGSGIIHQEMPKLEGGKLSGFQLWLNLPSAHKMMSPRYQDIPASNIPEIKSPDAHIRILAGEVNGRKGPVEDTIIKPIYLDVSLSPNAHWEFQSDKDFTMFLYVFQGELAIGKSMQEKVTQGNLALLSNGDTLKVSSLAEGARFVLISGKPIREPIAWNGPIVMNTKEQLYVAFDELERGTFIKD